MELSDWSKNILPVFSHTDRHRKSQLAPQASSCWFLFILSLIKRILTLPCIIGRLSLHLPEFNYQSSHIDSWSHQTDWQYANLSWLSDRWQCNNGKVHRLSSCFIARNIFHCYHKYKLDCHFQYSACKFLFRKSEIISDTKEEKFYERS